MIAKREFIFWVIVWVVLTLFFSVSLQGIVVSFYFVTILMPVVIATSVFFNRLLVPRYLLKDHKVKFVIYLLYMIIVSIYLELLVMVLAFVILADYQIANLGKIASDIYLLTVLMYLIVLVDGLILSIKKLRESAFEMDEIKQMLEAENQTEIAIRVNRKQVLLALDEIFLLESMGDYVKVYASSGTHVTKEKISSFEQRLPSAFIRIHRSFIVNKDQVVSFSKEEVRLGDQNVPIGRKYKKMAEQLLQQNAIA